MACWLAVAVLVLSLLGCRSEPSRGWSQNRFGLTKTGGHIETNIRQRENDRRARTATGNEQLKESIIEENVQLEAEGYVYHPNLLDFSIAALFGLQQSSFDQLSGFTTLQSRQNGGILEFDVSGNVFLRKPYPVTFFAQRTRSIEPRPFRSSVETRGTSYGFTWQYVSSKTPIQLRFNRTVMDHDPFLRAGEIKGRREDTTFRLEADYIFNKHNKLSLLLNSDSILEEPFAFSYDRDELRLTHRLEFGKEHKNRLDSEFTFLTQAGSFASDRIQWRESLWLQHSDQLRTFYHFEWADRRQGSLTPEAQVNEKFYYIWAGLEHKLYDSLDTRFLGLIQNQNFDSGLSIRRYGGEASFDYRKKNRWGLLSASYRFRFERENRGGGDQIFEVIDSAQTFQDSIPIILTDTNILSGSIVILREDRTDRFQPGLDYRLRAIGNTIELERIPTGRITDGETVLISYRFQLFGSFVLDTVDHLFSIRQKFDWGLTPYYRFRLQNQTLRPADAIGLIPEDILLHAAGVEYQRGPLRLLAEYENHDSSVSPFTSLRVGGDYTRRFRKGARINIGGRWSDVRFRKPNPRDTRLLIAEGRYHHPITRNLTVEGAVAYRKENDTLSGNNDGLDFNLSLDWIIRQTEIHVSYEWATFQDRFAQQDSTALRIQIRRSF